MSENMKDSYAYKYGAAKTALEFEINQECIYASEVADRHKEEFALMYITYTRNPDAAIRLAEVLIEEAKHAKEAEKNGSI